MGGHTQGHLETADSGPAKVTVAAQSLAAWYRFEQDRLQRERSLFRENLAVAELDRALQENAAEQRGLDAGWENSSLRRRIEDRAEQPLAPGGVERRVGLAAPGGPHLVSAARATSISTSTATAIQGYGAVFGKLSLDLGGFREKIQAGAFSEALKVSDIRCLFNHDSNSIFGRSTAATLELREDSHGLWFSCSLLPFDGASYGLARRIDRRDISGCSFSFIVGKDTWKLARRPGETDERTILEVSRLWDVGPVTYPAYPQTTVAAVFEKIPARSESPAAEGLAMTADEYFGDGDEELAAKVRKRIISPAGQRAIEGRLLRLESDIRERKLQDLEKRLRVAKYGWPWLRKTAVLARC